MILEASTSYPHSQTYVLKLHRDTDAREGKIAGRLEHVASGQQFRFSSPDELIACLRRAVALHGAPEDPA